MTWDFRCHTLDLETDCCIACGARRIDILDNLAPRCAGGTNILVVTPRLVRRDRERWRKIIASAYARP